MSFRCLLKSWLTKTVKTIQFIDLSFTNHKKKTVFLLSFRKHFFFVKVIIYLLETIITSAQITSRVKTRVFIFSISNNNRTKLSMSFKVEDIKKILDDLEAKLLEIPQLKKASKSVGVPLVYLIAAAIVALVILVYVASGFRAIVSLVAFVYPAWASLKAINSENKEDDTLWLTYWVFYGFFTGFYPYSKNCIFFPQRILKNPFQVFFLFVESITDVLLFWIPFYELIKMCFYLYLYQAKGALVLYDQFLKPIVVQVEAKEIKAKEGLNNIKNIIEVKFLKGKLLFFQNMI
ncbi:TB2/DP1/HVA22 family integral membrane protein [Reticulomyxa filosa]|uniref:TB2/DP1/HVA22 family integral membrane protein n=1 Tax=Reticulomyxa filosa TaxID=46433 RepID=X6N979_RETFI|nr:TB2/DP1/HVA22 family integral membrane protein [Reticulomyxa filosa]|eukprot:ETO21847.1 TB2/DP1/HVA22 family integral membrane protein [Reticulomyxa filosa]